MEAARKRKEKVGALITISREKMPGTKYDKFYMEEVAKKFKSDAHLEEFVEEVKLIQRQKGNPFAQEFENVVKYQVGRIEAVEKE